MERFKYVVELIPYSAGRHVKENILIFKGILNGYCDKFSILSSISIQLVYPTDMEEFCMTQENSYMP